MDDLDAAIIVFLVKKQFAESMTTNWAEVRVSLRAVAEVDHTEAAICRHFTSRKKEKKEMAQLSTKRVADIAKSMCENHFDRLRAGAGVVEVGGVLWGADTHRESDTGRGTLLERL